MKVNTGDQVPAWEMAEVSADRMKTMAAILRDPYPVHWDPEIVEKMGMGRRTINQGPLGLAYMVNMLHAWTGEGSIRRLKMTFPLPVFSGDHIMAKGVVTGVREENGQQLADCDIWLEQNGNPDQRPLVGSATIAVPD
jgi:acyl dehydratase